MLKFFTLSFWFAKQPYLSWVLITILVIGILALIAGFYFARKKNKLKQDNQPAFLFNFYRKTANLFYVTGVLLLMVNFFAYQNTIFFSMRFWFLLIIVLFAWRLWWLLKYKKKDIPRLTQERQSREDMQKYMPKQNKKSRRS